jgi:DNA-binding response OmpR family regulator
MLGGTELTKHLQNTVLVLEDQPLIALEVEELLNKAGFSEAITCISCADAKQWLETHTPYFAILETRLPDGPSDEISQILASRNVPIIVHSADVADIDQVAALTEASRFWINKPCQPDLFLQAVRDCTEARP